MSASWKSNLNDFKRRDARAQKAALRAAATVYRKAIRTRLLAGYTTGAFVTGKTARMVRRGKVFPMGPGAWGIRVGTNSFVARAWELGFISAFTKQYERQERWRPVGVEQRQAMSKRFAESYRNTFAREPRSTRAST